MTTWYTLLDSPIDRLLLTSDGAALTGLHMADATGGFHIGGDWRPDDDIAPFPEARRQLSAYFDGQPTDFDLPLAPTGTEFQRRVWSELSRIPYGTTMNYGQLAGRVGNPNGARAVGLANGRNPLAIVVPCHRVIGANGRLVGYGGGLTRKAWLLQLEATVMARNAWR